MGNRQLHATTHELNADQFALMVKTHPHAVLALHAILCGALRLDDPGGEGFPGYKKWGLCSRGHEADLAALAVEAGGDDFGVLVVGIEPNGEADAQTVQIHPDGWFSSNKEKAFTEFNDFS
ncbi:hypothetical protein D3C84_875500 [compost metagenome]